MDHPDGVRAMKVNTANGPPTNGRRFYSIIQRDDDLVDVYLNPEPHPLTTEDGFTDYSTMAVVVRGIVPWEGLEEDIRRRYDAWCESGTLIEI